jgi:hypothetical protein
MAHDSKQGFFSSFFGNKKQKEQEEAPPLESRNKLDERIQRILAEQAAVAKPVIKEIPAVSMAQEEEAEPEIELLPISASVLSSRKARVQVSFVTSSLDAVRSYASNER